MSVEQRRAQRYNLQLPIEIVRLGGRPVNRTEKTRNISSGGVCFVTPDDVEVGGRIEYVITLSGSTPPVKIRCLGKVLRCLQPRPANGQFEIACTMERYAFVRPGEFQAVAASTELTV